jgi:hypothetical protein
MRRLPLAGYTTVCLNHILALLPRMACEGHNGWSAREQLDTARHHCIAVEQCPVEGQLSWIEPTSVF